MLPLKWSRTMILSLASVLFVIPLSAASGPVIHLVVDTTQAPIKILHTQMFADYYASENAAWQIVECHSTVRVAIERGHQRWFQQNDTVGNYFHGFVPSTICRK